MNTVLALTVPIAPVASKPVSITVEPPVAPSSPTAVVPATPVTTNQVLPLPPQPTAPQVPCPQPLAIGFDNCSVIYTDNSV